MADTKSEIDYAHVEHIAREIIDRSEDLPFGLVGVVHAATIIIAAMVMEVEDPVADLDRVLATFRAGVVEMIEVAQRREVRDA